MSEENVEIARQQLERFNSGDYDAALSLLDPEIEWHLPWRIPDLPETVQGQAQVLRAWHLWDDVFGKVTLTILSTKDLGERVFAHLRMEGPGQRSGIAIATDLYLIAAFRDGLITRIDWHSKRDRALEAAGLSE